MAEPDAAWNSRFHVILIKKRDRLDECTLSRVPNCHDQIKRRRLELEDAFLIFETDEHGCLFDTFTFQNNYFRGERVIGPAERDIYMTT